MSSVSVKSRALFYMGMTALLLAGCNSENVKTSDAGNQSYTPKLAHATSTSVAAKVTKIPVSASTGDVTLIDRIAWVATKQQGKMYRYGGKSPNTGFDCSGLTQFAFGQGAGVSLPRTAAEQYAVSVKIPQQEASKGDLIFFQTTKKRISHVGLYMGDNQFVHAPRTGKKITTEKLEGYWADRLVGFGRIPAVCKPVYS